MNKHPRDICLLRGKNSCCHLARDHWETVKEERILGASKAHHVKGQSVFLCDRLSMKRFMEWDVCTVSPTLCARPRQHLRTQTRSSIIFLVMCSSLSAFHHIPANVFMGCPLPCCTWVIMLAAPPAAAMTYVKESSGLEPSVYGGGGSPSSAALLDGSPLLSDGSAALVSCSTVEAVL